MLWWSEQKCFGKHLRCAKARTKGKEHKQLAQIIAKLLHSFETVIARKQKPLGKKMETETNNEMTQKADRKKVRKY